MARLQCTCGAICRSKTAFKMHTRSFNDGTMHLVKMTLTKFKVQGPNKTDKRKERERKERDGLRS